MVKRFRIVQGSAAEAEASVNDALAVEGWELHSFAVAADGLVTAFLVTDAEPGTFTSL